MLRYPAKLIPHDGKVLVSFPGFPDVHTLADDEPEALAAVDVLETMRIAMIEHKEEIPSRSRFAAAPASSLFRC